MNNVNFFVFVIIRQIIRGNGKDITLKAETYVLFLQKLRQSIFDVPVILDLIYFRVPCIDTGQANTFHTYNSPRTNN